MFSLRQRIFVSVSIILGVLGLIVVGILLTGRMRNNAGQLTPSSPTSTADVPVAPAGLIQQPGAVPPPSNVTTPSFSNDIPKERLARQVAELFVERFSTRSNQNDNAHIDAVLPFLTPSMSTWVQTQTVAQSGPYTGVRTDVITTVVIDITDTTAAVRIEATQLVEGETTSERIQKTGRVDMTLDANGVWKVNGFFWDK